MGLEVDANIDPTSDFWGYTVDDLQENVKIGKNSITGTLRYIEDYSSAFPAGLDSGNYIAIHASVPDEDDVTITVTVTNPSVLDEDGIAILRIADKNSQTIKVVASKEGYESVTKEYSLKNLVCEEAPSEVGQGGGMDEDLDD